MIRKLPGFAEFVENILIRLEDFQNKITRIEQILTKWDKFMANKFDNAGNLVADTAPLTGRKIYTALSAIDGTTIPKFCCLDPAGTGKLQYCQKTANAIAFTDSNVDAGANAMWIAIADSTTTSLAMNASGSFAEPNISDIPGFSGLISGEKYFIGPNGTIVIYSALNSNDWSCFVGIAQSATVLKLEHGSVPFQKP